MAGLSADSLAQTHEQEFARLRRATMFTPGKLALFGILFLVTIIITLRWFSSFSGDVDTLREARSELLASADGWGQEFSDSQSDYESWLTSHGTSFELHTFNRMSEILFMSAASFSNKIAGDEPSLFVRTYLSLHEALLRISFLILACMRLWLVAIIAVIVWSSKNITVYNKRDILGQTGNGRIFFSGARIALDNVTDSGAPADQVTSLACPASVGTIAAKVSELGKILENYKAINTTNLSLLGIILKYEKYPAYVARHDQIQALDEYFAGAKLSANTKFLLEKSLGLHAQYAAKVSAGNSKIDDDIKIDSLAEPAISSKITSSQYVDILGNAMHRVLTPNMRANLGALDPATVATIVLAFEAGKAMAYSFEGGRWIRKSNFPQLCARSILHSIPEFAQEYQYDLREVIRRAIIFGSRTSLFGPVKFPIDLSNESRAARQWGELLLAAPHELDQVADEVELVGLITEIHAGWEKIFFEGTLSLDPEVIEDVYTTPANLLFMPVTKIVKLMRRVVTRQRLDRLEQLVTVVSQRQKLKGVNLELSPDEDDLPHAVPSYEKIFSPFTPQQSKDLQDNHGIQATDLLDWSAIRVALNAHGWLGRRVWERSVPESSIVYAVFKADRSTPGTNELGLIGQSGMVPLRGTKPEERWGKHWQSRFIQVDSARMAENKKDFERLMRGEEDDNLDEEDTSTSNAQGANS